MKFNKRVTFSTDEEFLNEINLYVAKNKNKYRDRTEFMNVAVKKLMEEENEVNTIKKINNLENEIKKLKSLLELNLQFTYSIMEDKNIRSSNLYYGNTLNAIKSKEAIDDFYRDKLMNENKIKSENKNIKKENFEEPKEESKSRWRITDL